MVEDFADLGTPVPKKSCHFVGPSLTDEAEQTLEWPRQRNHQQKTLVVNRVVVGPFEEEEEGIGIASDIVKVEGEDPATPGCLRDDRVRRYVGDSRSWVSIAYLG